MGAKLMCAAIISLVSIQNVQQLYDVMASVMNEEVSSAFI